MPRITVRPVTPRNRGDFEALFSSRGCPHFCWCALYRHTNASAMDSDQKRAAMLARIDERVPVGVLAYDGREPVGWCSVAPRETYARLDRSRTMPQVDEGAWTVLCFFVRRDHRGAGVARALLAGATRYARSQGAPVIEGYPFDSAGIVSTHRGHSSLFKAAGFRRHGRRWARALRSRL